MRWHREASRRGYRRGTPDRRGVAVLVATAAVLLAAAPALAAPTPTPSPDKVAAAKAAAATSQRALDAAKQAADADTAKVRQAQAAVVDAQRSLATLSAKAKQAVEKYTAAMKQLKAAQDAQAEAAAQLVNAQAAVARQQRNIDDFVSAAYKSGGPVAMAATLVDATSPGDLVQRFGYLNQVSGYQAQQLAEMDAARAARDEGARAAAAAASQVQRTAAAADAARLVAVSAVADQQSIVKTLAKAQGALTKQRAADRVKVARLGKARSDALTQLARAQQQAAAEAAAAAAAERASLLAVWLSGQDVTSNLPEATPEQGRAALAWATKQLGVPYSWGGGNADGPTLGFTNEEGNPAGLTTVGFDCSGLTLYAWAHVGFSLGHYTGYQWLQGKHIPLDQVREGDLLFFATDITDPLTIHHVGMYAGGGKMVDAPFTGAVVRYDPAFNSELIGAVRP